MWIKTTCGVYVNLDHVFKFEVSVSKLGDYNVTAVKFQGDMVFVARFENKSEAQEFLDALSRNFGRVIDANMIDWHYAGHKKDHKETRHGGS